MTFRLIARRNLAGVRLITCKGNDFTKRFPLIAMAVAGLPVTVLPDYGEDVVCDVPELGYWLVSEPSGRLCRGLLAQGTAVDHPGRVSSRGIANS